MCCAELSWHTAANYIPGPDEQVSFAHIQKSKQRRKLLSVQRFAAFMLQSQAVFVPNSSRLHMLLHNLHHPGDKDIFFSADVWIITDPGC